jgi:uncharacterized protein
MMDSTPRPSLPARILLAFLSIYRYAISPVLHGLGRILAPAGGGCRFQPTCSEYAQQAIAIHGAGRGSWLALTRLLRCHPFSRGGPDPVPPRQHLP